MRYWKYALPKGLKFQVYCLRWPHEKTQMCNTARTFPHKNGYDWQNFVCKSDEADIINGKTVQLM